MPGKVPVGSHFLKRRFFSSVYFLLEKREAHHLFAKTVPPSGRTLFKGGDLRSVRIEFISHIYHLEFRDLLKVAPLRLCPDLFVYFMRVWHFASRIFAL